MTFPGMKDVRQRADLVTFLKEATQPGRAPKTAQGGNQMGGMMMGGGQVPNLKKLDPEDRVQFINHCGDTYKVDTADGRFAISGSGICASRRMSVMTVRRKVRPPSCPQE
jgi:cytochrome c